jgi:hypothetical protein
MKLNKIQIIIGVIFFLYSEAWCNDLSSEYVVLLHGLIRTESSMEKLAKHLSDEGFGVFNLGYPSRSKTIEVLAEEEIPKALVYCRTKGAKKIHFATHSMGGILVRYYLKHHDIQELGRVVMISPPNNGSEIVDKLGGNCIFKWLNGPAGSQLGTDDNSMPKKLGTVDADLGVITGDRSVNLILSYIIPGKDDGKVSVESAKIKGMNDFIVIHATHPFIMKNRYAIEQTTMFLKYGKFKRDNPSEFDNGKN